MRFLSRLILLLISASGVFAAASPVTNNTAYSRTVEIRSVWMDRRSIPSTEQGIRHLVRLYARSGINVLHPEVIYNGYSAYPSRFLEQQNLWGGLDMLAIVIDEAHKQKMEVHPWVWVFRTGNVNDKGGILKKHPDWAALDGEGNALSANQGYWLCPSIPEVRCLLLDAFRELASKYPIDGIQLDYIRFETQTPVSYCYNASCRSKFQARHGIDPCAIEPFTEPVIDWHLWREDLVNTFVAQVCGELKKVRPGIVVSAAVGSLPDNTRVELLQNWAHWADNKWVDFLTPMDYTANPSVFQRQVQAAAQRVQSRALLSPGIGLHVIQSPDIILKEIGITRAVPAEGATLFSTAYLDPTELEAMRCAPFRTPASIPLRNPVDQAKKLISSAGERLKAGISHDTLVSAQTDLATAGSLLKYVDYRKKVTGYVPPTRPPVFIPREVQPLPEVSVPLLSVPPVLDGKLDDETWRQASIAQISATNLGFDVTQPTDILIARDADNLYLAFRAHEPNPDRLKTTATAHDAPVFTDDSIEIFLSGQGRTYYHFALNAIGTTFEQRVFDPKWNGNWQTATAREERAWTAEVQIPLATIEQPSPANTLRANFCRNRIIDSTTENSCWSPTYGSYHTPIRFGTLSLTPSPQ